VIAVLIGAASWALGVCVAPRLQLPRDAMGRTAVPLLCGAGMLLLVAVLVGWLWASEAMSLRIVVATMVILGAIVLIQKGERSSSYRPARTRSPVADARH
jgi:hypothetical protein